jgi:YNFM family putative membrane transporter
MSWIFLVYLLGSFTSAEIRRLVDRVGRSRALMILLMTMAVGALVTLSSILGVIVAGVAIFTCGFFGAHSIASSWVGSRAQTARAQAASLYLFAYYFGSSVSGTAGGLFWSWDQWPGVVLLILALLLMGLFFYRRLSGFSRDERFAAATVNGVEGIHGTGRA